MGWFEKQIKQREDLDQQLFEDSFFKAAEVVLGKRAASEMSDERIITSQAIEDILKYYHFKPVEIPKSVKEHEEQLDYSLRPHGIMRRNIELDEGWYKDSYGPVLAYFKEDETPVALLPKKIVGYYYIDRSTGKKITVNAKNAALFAREAYCFYKPLPQRKIGIPDLLMYMKDCLSVSDIAIVVLATLAATLVGMMIPRITKALTGQVLQSGELSALLGVTVCLVCVALASNLITAVNGLLTQRLKTKTSVSVEAALLMRILTLPAPFFRKYSAGELNQRSQSINMLCTAIMTLTFSTGLSSLFSLLYVTQIFSFAPGLVIPSLLVILVTIVFTVISSLMQVRITKLHMEHQAKQSGMAYSMITGVQKLKLSGAEKRIFSKWLTVYAEGAELQYNPPMFLKINSVINLAITLGSTVLLYWLAAQSGIDASSYLAFNAAYGSFMGAFMALANIALQSANIKPVLEMAEPFLNAEPEAADNKEMVTKISGAIELNNVYFRYNENTPYIVDNMSLKINAGEYIAIVGRTGCGKSTLMRLLLGFEKPERGAIYYDNKDMKSLDMCSLRRKIGAVTQNGGLFQGDIYSNIVISAPELTLNDAWEAAEIAGIADDIRAMPMGMQTMVSEGQGGISGGQKQRLMIARAVAPKPKLLMFDEATSALDNKTQKQVSEALDRMGCTRIVIAHRLSTIKNCDRILVLDKGKIIEDGSYDELIAKGGYFAELVERQRLDVQNS
ncbi:MAG: NHLP bacteriocin export ABC transporter permease/ATPase subunit [Ruminiclostridium sp.]|nr:NHLP bacteriocin export ABC transporter permease/ATPase subunit [Ruminiclostridium sp.]